MQRCEHMATARIVATNLVALLVQLARFGIVVSRRGVRTHVDDEHLAESEIGL